VNPLIGRKKASNESIQKLKTLKIVTVYPSHGEPFSCWNFLGKPKNLKPNPFPLNQLA
jgi:hypothetical protein